MPPKKPAQVSINHNQTGYVCAKCRKPIPIDHMMAFQDKHYHPDCFICDGGCGKPLAGGAGFFEQPEGLFCKDCFANKKAPKCKGCNKPVVEKVLRFDGDAWHPECFTCAGCKDPLDGKEITQVDGKAMCKDCYINKFTDKCYKCNKPISPGQPFMEIEGGKMHADCFKCADCGKNLAGEACVKIVDNYICSNCSRRR